MVVACTAVVTLARAAAPTASRARVFVLGGDVFDFRWSTLDSTDATAKAAIRWLDDLVGSHSKCDFHFVLGNHDCNRRFVSALESYARTRPNLTAHPYYLRLGRNIFLHGDAADRPQMCPARLHRRRQHWARDERRGSVRNMLYDLAVQAQLHRVVGKVAHRYVRGALTVDRQPQIGQRVEPVRVGAALTDDDLGTEGTEHRRDDRVEGA